MVERRPLRDGSAAGNVQLFLTGPYGMRTDPSPSSVVILSCSLNPSSRSHKLALAARAFLRAREVSVELVVLAEHDLPLCDGTGSFDHPSVKTLTGIIDAAGAILVSSPVYNYDLSAAAKNLMELTGSAWTEKPVGFLCAGGGRASYMSPIGFANSLMFDFRCLIVPRFVYCTKDDFTEAHEPGPKIQERVEQLAADAVDLSHALAWVRENKAAVAAP